MSAIARTVVVALVAVLASIGQADACECGGNGACGLTDAGTAYWAADEVFIGVARITPRGTTGGPGGSHVAMFTIEESFRGRETGTVTIGLADRISCDYLFTDGERYLVMATPTPDGRLEASKCGRTRPLGDAGEDLATVRAIARGQVAVGRVAGRAQMVERAAGTPDGWTSGAFLPGLVVTLRGPGGVLSTETAESGRYSFASVRPGTYVVTVDGPPSVTLALGERVTLPGPGACVHHRIGLSRLP